MRINILFTKDGIIMDCPTVRMETDYDGKITKLMKKEIADDKRSVE